MQEIFNFVKVNWQLISAICTFIVSVIIALIRKRPVNDIMSAIYDFAIYGINRFEAPGNGAEKKERVVKFIKDSLKNVFPGLNVKQYEKIIDKTIETILTTPQKKGSE